MPDPQPCTVVDDTPVQYEVDNRNVRVTINWEHDGVSAWPNCDGPLISVRLVNDSDFTYYCNLPAKKKGLRNFPINPHTDTTYNANQLKQAGLDVLSDTNGVTPHRNPLDLI